MTGGMTEDIQRVSLWECTYQYKKINFLLFSFLKCIMDKGPIHMYKDLIGFSTEENLTVWLQNASVVNQQKLRIDANVIIQYSFPKYGSRRNVLTTIIF
jgi:hypothetical protein